MKCAFHNMTFRRPPGSFPPSGTSVAAMRLFPVPSDHRQAHGTVRPLPSRLRPTGPFPRHVTGGLEKSQHETTAEAIGPALL